jgi:phage shock protein E
MEWIIVWIVGVAVIAMLLRKRTASTSPEILHQHLQNGALVIDVRSAEEFRSGHAPGAVNIPLHELRMDALRHAPDKETVLLLYCLSGMRSLNGMRQLKRLGYKNVFNLGSLHRANQIVSHRTEV